MLHDDEGAFPDEPYNTENQGENDEAVGDIVQHVDEGGNIPHGRMTLRPVDGRVDAEPYGYEVYPE